MKWAFLRSTTKLEEIVPVEFERLKIEMGITQNHKGFRSLNIMISVWSQSIQNPEDMKWVCTKQIQKLKQMKMGYSKGIQELGKK